MTGTNKLFSQRLAGWTDEFDRTFNHLLGYIIAFTSLVAFADVLGNGQITEHLPWLYWPWIIAQGLCVEAQVLILVKRMPGYWQSNRLMFWVYVGFTGCLCVMSVLIGSVFVQHDTEHGTIESAMYALGIPHIGFIYARSALAILLVALIAIDRAIEKHHHSVKQQEQARSLVHTDQLAQQQAEMASVLAQVVATVKQLQSDLPTTIHGLQQTVYDLQASIQEVQQNIQFPQEREETDPVSVSSTPDQLAGIEEQIRTFLSTAPDASSRMIAAAIGCSHSTANKWAQRIREEQGHPQLRAVK